MKEKSDFDVHKVRAMGQHMSLYSSPTSQSAPDYGKSANANSVSSVGKEKDEVSEPGKDAPKISTPGTDANGTAQNSKTQSVDAASLTNVNNAIYVAHLNGSASAKPPAQPVRTPTPTGQEEQESEEKQGQGQGKEISQGGDGPQATNTHAASADGDEQGGFSMEDIAQIVDYVLSKVAEIRAIIDGAVSNPEGGGTIGEPAKAPQAPEDIPTIDMGDISAERPVIDGEKPALENQKNEQAPVTQATAKELDGVVDPYMIAAWDRTKYDELCVELGVSPNTVGNLMDKILPAMIPHEVRTSANFVYSASVGVLDAAFMAVLSGFPVIGLIAGPAFAFKDMVDSMGKVPSLENSWADEGILILEAIRGWADMTNGFVGGIEGILTLAEWLSSTVAGALGATVGTAAGPVGTGGGGTVGAGAGITVGGGLQLITLATSVALQDIIMKVDGMITLLSLWAAEDARQEGEFGKADAFGELAQEHAFKTIGDAIGIAATIGSEVLSLGLFPSTMAKELTERGVKTGTDVFMDVLRSMGTTGLQKLTENRLGLIDGVASGGLEWWEDAYLFTGADVMERSNPFITPSKMDGKGDASEILGGARTHTITDFDTSWESLKAENPDWHQQLINEIIAPQDPTFGEFLSKMMLPSGWIELALLGAEFGIESLMDLMLNMDAKNLEATAAMIEGPVEGAINWVIDMIAENSDLENDLDALNEIVENQRLTLESLRAGVETIEATLPVMQDAVDFGPEMSHHLNNLLNETESLKLTREQLNIPDIIPNWVINEALDPYNALVDAMIGKVRDQIDGIESIVSNHVQIIADIFQEKLDRFKLMIAEGSDAEKMFLAAQEIVAQQVSNWLEIASEFMKGNIQVDFSGFASFVRSISETAENATTTSRWAEFIDYVQNDAQAYVDDWKARHGREVHLLWYPAMPGEEITALELSYSLLKERLTNAKIDQEFTQEIAAEVGQEIERLYNTAKGQIGQHGKDQIAIFWNALNALGQISIPIGDGGQQEPEPVGPEPEKPVGPEPEKPVGPEPITVKPEPGGAIPEPGDEPVKVTPEPGGSIPVKEPETPGEITKPKDPVRIHVVVKGDNLWNLAKHYYGDPWKWPKIHEANLDKIKDPHWIYPNQRFVIPNLGEQGVNKS